MKWMNNKNASSLVSLLFLSFWHGIWIGYLLNFSLEFVYVKTEQQVSIKLLASTCTSHNDYSCGYMYCPFINPSVGGGL